jgi:hypothetical protein
MRTLRQLTDLVRVGRRPLGEEWWQPGPPLGSSVLTFEVPSHLPAFVSLHEQAHLWIHRDYDHGGWQLLRIAEPLEVGVDYVAMPRPAGVAIRSFYPALTDDPVDPPPHGRLERLHAVIDTLVEIARASASPIDRFLAELVQARVRGLVPDLVYDQVAHQFLLASLDPSVAELETWQELTRSPAALAAIPLVWERTGDAAAPFRTELAGRALTLQGSTTPYSLLVDGQALATLPAWPAEWALADPTPA